MKRCWTQGIRPMLYLKYISNISIYTWQHSGQSLQGQWCWLGPKMVEKLALYRLNKALYFLCSIIHSFAIILETEHFLGCKFISALNLFKITVKAIMYQSCAARRAKWLHNCAGGRGGGHKSTSREGSSHLSEVLPVATRASNLFGKKKDIGSTHKRIIREGH